MNILIVEDDRPLAHFMKRALETEKHTCAATFNGEDALDAAADDALDMVVLDLNLPGMDGTGVLRHVRERSDSCAVIVVTGRGGLQDRLQCLDLGADDVLVKPFALSELRARVQALGRRRERGRDRTLRLGALTLDRLEHSVLFHGAAVELTQKEFALLEYLMRHAGRCVARAELLEQVWQMPSTQDTNVVDVYINYLRRKLDSAAIRTVRGQGYLIVAEERKKPCVSWMPEAVMAAAGCVA